MTILRKKISKFIAHSQKKSGLSLQNGGCPASLIVLGTLLWGASMAMPASAPALSIVPEANASATPGNGTDALAAYSNGQRRHIRRAVLSEPQNLKKLHGLSILAALDKPEIIRKDLPAVVWQYRNNGCVLDVYFKSKDGKTESAPVVHYEVRNQAAENDNTPDARTCLRGIMDAHAGTQMVGVSTFYKSYIQ